MEETLLTDSTANLVIGVPGGCRRSPGALLIDSPAKSSDWSA